MSWADENFKEQIDEILYHGEWDSQYPIRPKWDDGTPAHSKYITHNVRTINYDLAGVPIQTVRPIAWKGALREILAIYQKRATTREEFEAMKVTWWEPWFNEEGNLGTSYAHQLKKEIDFPEGKFNQIDRVIHLLKNDPMNRRIITNMLNLEEMKDMALPPCAFMTHWTVRGPYLDLLLIQRSGDLIPAAGFGGVNTIQYFFLLAMIAQVTGYRIGKLTHSVTNLHVYDRHFDLMKKLRQADRFDAPSLWINPNIKNFYDFTDEDIKLNYYQHGPAIEKPPIAI